MPDTGLTGIERELHQLAHRVGAMRRALALPRESCTLQDAADRLRAVLGDAYFSIDMSLSFHSHRNGAPSVQWTIYEQKSPHNGARHEAATLDAVLAKALAAHAPAPDQTVEDVQRLIDTAPSDDDFVAGDTAAGEALDAAIEALAIVEAGG